MVSIWEARQASVQRDRELEEVYAADAAAFQSVIDLNEGLSGDDFDVFG